MPTFDVSLICPEPAEPNLTVTLTQGPPDEIKVGELFDIQCDINNIGNGVHLLHWHQAFSLLLEGAVNTDGKVHRCGIEEGFQIDGGILVIHRIPVVLVN